MCRSRAAELSGRSLAMALRRIGRRASVVAGPFCGVPPEAGIKPPRGEEQALAASPWSGKTDQR